MTTNGAQIRGIEAAPTHDPGDDIADGATSTVEMVRDVAGHAMDHLSDALETVRSDADRVAEHLPRAVDRVRIGVRKTTTTLQTMTDPTLRLLAAMSIGLATGLYLAGVPRLVALAAISPAAFAGGAIATRPEAVPGGAR